MVSWYERWHPELTLESLNTLSESMWTMLEDLADTVSYNIRLQCFVQTKLKDRLLYGPQSCSAHGVHNIVDRNSKADEIIGDPKRS